MIPNTLKLRTSITSRTKNVINCRIASELFIYENWSPRLIQPNDIRFRFDDCSCSPIETNIARVSCFSAPLLLYSLISFLWFVYPKSIQYIKIRSFRQPSPIKPKNLLCHFDFNWQMCVVICAWLFGWQTHNFQVLNILLIILS